MPKVRQEHNYIYIYHYNISIFQKQTFVHVILDTEHLFYYNLDTNKCSERRKRDDK